MMLLNNNFRLKWKNFLMIFVLSLFCFTKNAYTQTETMSAGSFIINMGVLPQDEDNALKPYGLVHELLSNGVQVKWIIEPTKAMDGTDFTYNGVNYRGGPFIVPAEFIDAAVMAVISAWQADGVEGLYTTSDISVPVAETLKVAPRWTLDQENGDIAEKYLNAANIPSSNWNEKDPQDLDCCDDLFVMPHADPEWDSHGRLYSWNGPLGTFINGEEGCAGGIWMACHAVSAMELMFDPSSPSTQTNFLSTKSGTAGGGGPYADPSNSLIHWDDHGDGTLPYTHDCPSDPIMQFLGIIDGATTNGSEQIYIPIPGQNWRPGAKKYVYDPNHPDGAEAAVMVGGKAYDDPDRGLILMEAGHEHNKSVFTCSPFFQNQVCKESTDPTGSCTQSCCYCRVGSYKAFLVNRQ